MEDELNIGFIYEYGALAEPCDDDLPKDKYWNTYLYYGKLSEVEKNIYSSDGNYTSAWDSAEDTISADKDFYVVLKGEKMFFLFEEMSIVELREYESDIYFMLYKSAESDIN